MKIRGVDDLAFKVQGPPGQRAELVVEIAIEGAGVNDARLADDLRLGVGVRLVEKVVAGEDLNVLMVGEALEPRGVTIEGQSLVGIAKITVIVGETHRESRND